MASWLLLGSLIVAITGCQSEPPTRQPVSFHVGPEPSEIAQADVNGSLGFAAATEASTETQQVTTASVPAVQESVNSDSTNVAADATDELAPASEPVAATPEPTDAMAEQPVEAPAESATNASVPATEEALAAAESAVQTQPPSNASAVTVTTQTAAMAPLSLEAATELALKASDAVKLMEADLAVAKAARRAAHDHDDPELGLRYNQGSSDQSDTPFVHDSLTGLSTMSTQSVDTASDSASAKSASLSIYPQNPIERHYRIAAANANAKAIEQQLTQVRWETRMEVARLYSDVEFLHKDLHLLTRLVGIYKEAVEVTEQRVAAGAATPQDTLAATPRYLRALSERSVLLQDYLAARDELSALLGVPGTDLRILALPPSFSDVDPATLDLDKLIQSALDNRADLEALAFKTSAAKSAYREACGSRMPWFTSIDYMYTVSESEKSDYLGVNNDFLDPQTVTSVSSSDDTQWRVSAGINIPIFSWFNKTPALRRAEYRKAEMQENLANESVSKDIQNAVAVLRDMDSNRKRYETTTAPVVRDMNQLMSQLADSDMSPQDLARIREQILDTERQRLRFERNFRRAIISLEKLIGMPLK